VVVVVVVVVAMRTLLLSQLRIFVYAHLIGFGIIITFKNLLEIKNSCT